MRYPSLAPAAVLPLGQAFAANSINTAIFRHHGIVTAGGAQFTAFYRDPETIRVVRRDISGARPVIADIQSPHPIHDAHNTISLGVDRKGHVHMAVCRHASGLAYMVSAEPGSVSAWEQPGTMTGAREDQVTYPSFVMAPPPQPQPLLFLYRHGWPERGEACLKRYSEDTRTWIDVQTPLLSGADNQPWSSGPYWNHPEYDARGVLHLSFVWRTAPLGPEAVINNLGMDYARSADNGDSWFASNRRQFRLPITQANSETVLGLPPASNLINQTGLATDSACHAHLAFYADDESGVPQYQHAWTDGSSWQRRTISQRSEGFLLRAGGTLPLPISRPEILVDDADVAYVVFRADFTQQRLAVLRLDPPDFVYRPDQLRILWEEPVLFAEPVIDRLRWRTGRILSMLVQKNLQPEEESYEIDASEPISIVDWDLVRSW